MTIEYSSIAKKWYGRGNCINMSDQNAKIDEKEHTIPMHNILCFRKKHFTIIK